MMINGIEIRSPLRAKILRAALHRLTVADILAIEKTHSARIQIYGPISDIMLEIKTLTAEVDDIGRALQCW